MPKGKSQNGVGFRRFLIFSGICLLVIFAIVALVYWQRQNIISWITSTSIGVTQLFGWGAVLLVLAILTLLVIIFYKPILLLRYWNRWIGMLILFGAIWGILALIPGSGYLEPFNLGGRIGQHMIGGSAATGVLIILVLAIAGIFFATPRGFARVVAGFFSWISGLVRTKPESSPPVPTTGPSAASRITAHDAEKEPELKLSVYPRFKPEPRSRPALPANGSKNWLWNRLHPSQESKIDRQTAGEALSGEGSQPVEPVDQIATKESAESKDTVVQSQTGEKKADSAATTQVTGQSKDLKQAAQEVWKKYGETASQVTVDGWKLPPIEILDNTKDIEFSQADNMKKAKLIEDALGSYGVEGKVVQINVGPTVTQFGLEPGWDRKLKEIKEKDKNGDIQRKMEEVSRTRVKVDRITSLSNDLALALAAPSIRIEAPVPGKSVVGIEVPNTIIGTVSLRSVVESNVYQKMQARAKLAVALGKGAGGESVVGDLTKMPHLLIAGATGSGKTVCLHAIICCLLLYNTPSDVRFIMIDPKRVELTGYNSLPHLATPVIVDTNKALAALRWLTQEMDKRYQTLAAARYRNIDSYNKARPNDRLPYLVLVIDELADLMMTAGEEVERTLCRLAQLARAVGIHLIVATQRPSVDVVTGLIKANFPTRISFAVTSQVDSRTILDSGGAEKLLGRGDMLYMPTEAAKPKRLQGCFVSDAETERLVYFWNNQKKETASQLSMEDLVAAEVAKAELPPEDPLMEEARKLAEQHETISASFLQRHLRIGYPRAARLMEQLEAEIGEIDETADEEHEDTRKER